MTIPNTYKHVSGSEEDILFILRNIFIRVFFFLENSKMDFVQVSE